MGASCVPSYANLFVGMWEREIFANNPRDQVEKGLLWNHYIDDIFFI